MLVMLNTLMDISEAESGTMQLRREPVALADIVSRAVDLYRDVAEAKGVTLAADGAGRRRRHRRSDAARAGRREPDRQRGEIHAAGGRVDVEVERDGDTAILRVRDTGPGIPADEQPRIFDRLFRGDTSRAERGLGLGLSLVKAIVEAHGGTVEVAERTRPRIDVYRPAAARLKPSRSDPQSIR